MTQNTENQGLDSKESRFVDEYLLDLDPKRAAIAAGYSESVATSKAFQWVAADGRSTKPHLLAEVRRRMQARSERTQITQDRVLLEIARLAFHDPRKAFDEAGNLLPIKQWPDEVAAAVSSIKVKRVMEGDIATEVSEIKFWDKGKQVELAGRHLGLFEKDNKQKAALTVTLDKADEKL